MQLQRGRLASGSLSKSPTLPHPLFSALLVSPLPGNTNSGKAGRRKASLSSFIAAAAANAVNESRLEWSESALTARVSADGCMLAFPSSNRCQIRDHRLAPYNCARCITSMDSCLNVEHRLDFVTLCGIAILIKHFSRHAHQRSPFGLVAGKGGRGLSD